MIAKETEAEILRLYSAEGWFPSTIASQVQLHYSTVKRVLKRAAGTVHTYALQQILEQRRRAKGLTPPVSLKFANKVDGISVVPKSLDIYDQLIKQGEE